MRKLFIVVSMVLLIFCVCVSCSTTKVKANEATTAEPEWWNNTPADTSEYHYEVDMGKGANEQISRDMAKANVNDALARYVNNTVESIVTTYVNEAGEIGANNTQALTAFESVSKQYANASLVGVTYEFYKRADGTMYVLAKLPIGQLAEQLKADVRDTFAKNAASEEANEMMNNAIDKYFVLDK